MRGLRKPVEGLEGHRIGFGAKQSLMVQRFEQCAPFQKRTKAFEPHRVEPLEDVEVFAMPRCAAVLLDESLNLLEAGEDALFLRRPPFCFLGRRELREL